MSSVSTFLWLMTWCNGACSKKRNGAGQPSIKDTLLQAGGALGEAINTATCK
jgi:hypothetical protein